MVQSNYDRDRRIAVGVIVSALLALVLSNSLFVADVPYLPFRFLAVLGATVAIFATVFAIVLRHQPDWWAFGVLAAAATMVFSSLVLQLESVKEAVNAGLGMHGAMIDHVFVDSLTEVALGSLILVTVSAFVRGASARHTAQQHAVELETTRSALAESEERFRRVFEDGPIGMALVDLEYRVVEVNRVLCEMLGYSEQELCGRKADFLTHPDDVGPSRGIGRNLLEGEVRSQTIEERYRKKDGSWFWGRMTAALIRDHAGVPLYCFGMIENITQRRQMELAQQHDREFLRSLLDLHERERRVTAHEIHDGFVQQTVAAKMHLEAFSDRTPRLPGEQRMLDLAVDSLENAINEGRRMIGELRPLIIDEGGIVAAIEYLVSESIAKRDMQIEFVHDVRFGRLDSLLEGTIFRITQEALTNVWRHSQSDCARIELAHNDEQIQLEIRDDGIGFNPTQLDASRFGVRGMQERARLFGGHSTIESAPGDGTRVSVELPIRHARPIAGAHVTAGRATPIRPAAIAATESVSRRSDNGAREKPSPAAG